ncbi:protein eva-1 homolog A [Dama dama]|uniref:protein eva-1 homolog A n=1 Tax=Dama dama TaxID=30532 RepID=UPI002A35FA04|nr:protein eva-1 homolog A [Dama dama]
MAPFKPRVAGLGKGRGWEGRSRAEWVEWRGQTEGNETTFSSHRLVILLRLLGLPPPPVSAQAGTACPQVSTGVSFRIASASLNLGHSFAASSSQGSAPGPPAPPPAPGARTPEVRAGGSGEENPEGAALYFVSGVCVGLVLTLAALVMRSSCHTDCCQRSQKLLKDQESSSNSSDSEDGSLDAASDISVRRHRRFERTLNKNVFTSVEELERAQRLEERERIIREIWMNGQPEAPGTRSLNRYY